MRVWLAQWINLEELDLGLFTIDAENYAKSQAGFRRGCVRGPYVKHPDELDQEERDQVAGCMQNNKEVMQLQEALALEIADLVPTLKRVWFWQSSRGTPKDHWLRATEGRVGWSIARSGVADVAVTRDDHHEMMNYPQIGYE